MPGDVLTPALVGRLVAAAMEEHAAMLASEGKVDRFGVLLQRDGKAGFASITCVGYEPTSDWIVGKLERTGDAVGADATYAGKGEDATDLLVLCVDRAGHTQNVTVALPQPARRQFRQSRIGIGP